MHQRDMRVRVQGRVVEVPRARIDAVVELMMIRDCHDWKRLRQDEETSAICRRSYLLLPRGGRTE